MRLLDDIINKEIVDSQGNMIGKVKDMEINTSSYKIESIIVTGSTSKIKKGKKEEDMIPFEEVGSIGDKIILREGINDIKDLFDIY
ncbi:MAG: hypothetical protein BZ138_05600 [Methanosphaera sp. rholeuAM270]|nr:MAG: hypothetical protein BZ138_05600 [Methanosphaera sp. rholeuAM270]